MSKRKRLASPANDTIGTYGHLRFSIFQAVAVDDVRLSAADVRALAALGSHATAEHGYWCWPEVSTLSDRLGVTLQRVRQSIAALESCGYIEVCERYDPDDGHQLANGYRLIMDYELPDECRRCNNERPRKGIGGRPTHRTPRNSEFRGEGELRVSPQAQLTVSPQAQLTVSASESEKKKQKKETEKTRVRGASPSIAEKVVENAEQSAPSTPPTPPPSPASAKHHWLILDNGWREVVDALVQRKHVTEAEASHWLRGGILFLDTDDREHWHCILAVPTRLQRDAVRDRFGDRIRAVMADQIRKPLERVIFEVSMVPPRAVGEIPA